MNNNTNFAKKTKYDVICLGRAGVDFYANQIGSRLEDVISFNKYLGGSSNNIAFGCARLGLKSAMLTRVGNEHMGRFLREALEKEGCDVSHVKTDPERLTAGVILGIKDKDTFPLIFLRENCADMAISPDDFDESFIASSKSLLITGTHLSTKHVLSTSVTALRYARKNNVRTVLDIDFRPVLWGLTGKGEGENRFVESDSATDHLQSVVEHFDLIIGTLEEFYIAGGSTDIIECLRKLRKKTSAVFVVKLGPIGCAVIDGKIPDTIEESFVSKGVKVEVLNVLGAGDAFMAGFLKGWLNSEDYSNCCKYANLCGALVVSRHSCSPSMPSVDEFEYYLKNAESIPRPDLDPVLNRLHRVSVPRKKWKELCIFAFDHRIQIENLLKKYDKSFSMIPDIKQLLLKAYYETVGDLDERYDSGVLVDDKYGHDVLNDLTGKNKWIARPIELPGSRPLEMECGRNLSARLSTWPAEHIVKCLVFYHPDEPEELRNKQENTLLGVYEATQFSGHNLLLEVIQPKDMEYGKDTMNRSVQRFYDLGIYPDWWKLPPCGTDEWSILCDTIRKNDPYCQGVVVLGLNKPLNEFHNHFSQTKGFDLIRGFAVGRTIFFEPLIELLTDRIDEFEFVHKLKGNFQAIIELWYEARN